MSIRLDNASSTPNPTYSQTNDTNEQTVLTSALTYPRRITVKLDLTNLTQNSTIRCKEAIDGTNYRTLDTNDGRNPYAFTVASDDDGCILGPFDTARPFRVTIQAGVVEGAARSIPYSMVEEIFD